MIACVRDARAKLIIVGEVIYKSLKSAGLLERIAPHCQR